MFSPQRKRHRAAIPGEFPMSGTFFRRSLAVVALTVVIAACSGGGYQRGIFQGYVVNATEEEIVSKIGKPDRIDAADPAAPRWYYAKKTFDPDNMNKVDEQTIVVLKKDPKTGQMRGAEVLFL
jgi:hypothetical protein